MTDTIVAPIKSAWASKINWAQAGSAASMLVTTFGLDIPDKYKATALAVVITVQSIATWIMRTWFTTSITSAST